jgi:PAS domain S-box-containing protein
MMSKDEYNVSGEQDARPTIAYLAPRAVFGSTAVDMWSGVEAGAREQDLSLIAFPGGNIRSQTEGQGNVIYDLITPDIFSGLVTWAASLQHPGAAGGDLSDAELLALHARYHPLPIVTLSKAVPGHPVVLVENEQGMRDAIAHLIEVHGLYRIAFIRGPETHPLAQTRYRAYLDTLGDHGIEMNRDLVTPPGRFSRDAGFQAIDLFLDQRNLQPKEDIEAIVAASDIIVLGAMEALQRRSIRVPEDVALVGFNNSAEARSASPPITSVTVPLREQSVGAVNALKLLMEGESVPDEVTIPSRLALHQSCGCLDVTVAQAGMVLPDAGAGVSLEEALVTRREVIVGEMVQAMDTLEGSAWAESMLDGFILALDESQPGEFLAALREVLRRVSLTEGVLSAWYNVLSVLQRYAISYVDAPKALLLIGQARTMLGETTSRAVAQRQFEAERRAQALQAISSDLIVTFEVDRLMDVLAEGLPRLGIPSCYLALYEDPQPYVYPQPAPEWSRLIMAYNEDERVALEPGGTRFPTRHLVPEGMLPAHRRYTMVLQPLFFQDNQIGFVLFEVGPQEWSVYSILRGEIASALQGALLVRTRTEAEAALVRERDYLRTLLDNSPDYIFFKDRESRFVRTNKAHAQNLLGVSDPHKVEGKTDFDLYPGEEENTKRFYDEEQRLMETGVPVIGREWTVPSQATGEEVWLSEHKIPVLDETGQAVGLVGIGRDISSLKQAEHTLERRALQLQTAAEVSREATAILDLRQLLDRVVNRVSDGFGFYHTGIFLLDETKQHAVMRAASSEGGRRMLERGHSLPVGGVGIVGHVAATNESRVALDVGEDSVFFSNVDLPDTRSEAALPLAIRGQVVGVLDVQSQDTNAFSEDDVAVLRVLADQLAITIENARLVERTEAQLQELSVLTQQYTAEAVGRLLVSDRSLGFVYDRVDTLPLDASPAAHKLAVERGERVVVGGQDSEGPVTAVPLRIRGQVIGSLGVEAEDGRGWSPEEMAVIEAVSEQVAQALESAQLFAEAQRSAQQMQALYETSRTISSSMEEETLMHSVMESVQRTLGCELILVASVNEETGTIGVQYSIWRGRWSSAPEWVDMSWHSLDQPGILADIYHTGRTEIVREWDGRFDRNTWDEYGLGQFLRVLMPITLRDRTLGVIQVIYDKRAKASVSEDEKQMLSAFMDQAAVALENVRLFEQTRSRAERERQIYDITTKLRRSPDIATILQTAVEELGQALRADRAVVRLKAKPHEE